MKMNIHKVWESFARNKIKVIREKIINIINQNIWHNEDKLAIKEIIHNL